MQLRKLDSGQHGITRGLWEKVFPEDSKAFLDYYYFLKTRDNQIYVIEEEEAIRSMLQLNPYLLQIEAEQHLCNYIIAVATEESFRKRGYMGQLLRTSMQGMYAEKQPFTFLMPAAEAIYSPYDFRFIYAQNQYQEYGIEGSLLSEVKDAELGDASDIARFFFENFAGNFNVCAIRDAQYYQTMLFEQKSMGGGIKFLKHKERIVGCFAYAKEENIVEIKEPLFLPEYEADILKCICQVRLRGEKPAKVSGSLECGGGKSIPLIMARILHLETLLKSMKLKKGTSIDCSFAVLDSILIQNSKVWKLQDGEEDQRLQIKETEDSEGVLTIGALTSFLFGYKNIEEIRSEENVVIPERLGRELEKIQPLQRVFLNEIV